MKAMDLFDAFGGIDEELVLDAAPSGTQSAKPTANNRFLKRFSIIAACFVLVAACVFSVFSMRDPSYKSDDVVGGTKYEGKKPSWGGWFDGWFGGVGSKATDAIGTEGIKTPDETDVTSSNGGGYNSGALSLEDFQNKMADHYDDKNYACFYMQGETSYFLPTLKLSNYTIAVVEPETSSYTYIYVPSEYSSSYRFCDNAISVNIWKTKDDYIENWYQTFAKNEYKAYENDIFGTVFAKEIDGYLECNCWHNEYFVYISFPSDLNLNLNDIGNIISFETVSLVN